jgi:hypothetical protein
VLCVCAVCGVHRSALVEQLCEATPDGAALRSLVDGHGSHTVHAPSTAFVHTSHRGVHCMCVALHCVGGLQVDDFYYEHHVVGSPMAKAWQPSFAAFLAHGAATQTSGGSVHGSHGSHGSHGAVAARGRARRTLPTLNDSYALFRRLREAGVRAHSWV